MNEGITRQQSSLPFPDGRRKEKRYVLRYPVCSRGGTACGSGTYAVPSAVGFFAEFADKKALDN